METIYNNTRLTNDICKIVYKYIDYSIKNLIKLFPQKQDNSYFTIKEDVNIIDIFIKAFKKGYKGIVFGIDYEVLKEDIDEKIEQENLHDLITFVDSTDRDPTYGYIFNIDAPYQKYMYCDIFLFPEVLQLIHQ